MSPRASGSTTGVGRQCLGPFGDTTVEVPLDRIPLFVRAGAILPKIPDDVMTLVPKLDDRRVYQIYPGAGRSLVDFEGRRLVRSGNRLRISGKSARITLEWRFGHPGQVRVNGAPVSVDPDSASATFVHRGVTVVTWSDSVAPFRVIGNIYYVGGTDIATYLIATSDGLILLDGGLPGMAPQVLTNLRALGFDPRQVREGAPQHSAHYDHAGALARLKEITGARLYAGRGDSTIWPTAGTATSGSADRFLFPQVTVDHPVSDGDSVRLGATVLVAVATPGHTRGCTTWSMSVNEGGKDYAVLFICSLSIPGYDPTPPPGVSDARGRLPLEHRQASRAALRGVSRPPRFHFHFPRRWPA